MSNPSENAVDKAKRLDMDLVMPKPNEIFVDLDSDVALQSFLSRFQSFVQVYPLATVEYTTSKSGYTHAYVTIPGHDLAMVERIAMQASLGSDPLREMIALKRHHEGYEYASVFFEKRGTIRRDAVGEINAAAKDGGGK